MELIQFTPVTTHPLSEGIQHKVGVGIPLLDLVDQLVHLPPKHLVCLFQGGDTLFIGLDQLLLLFDLRTCSVRQPRRR
jgi:hypothetical protein